MITTILVLLILPSVASSSGCNSQACEKRVKERVLNKKYQRMWSAASEAVRSHLRRIAQCESTNNERAISPDGKYRGLLQFSFSTWSWVGGKGDPAVASRWEQWARGVKLYLMRGGGPQHWPVCQFA